MGDTGVAHPLEFTPLGGIAASSVPDRIKEAVRQVLGTRKGERLMRPDFGCGFHRLLFEPNLPVFNALARQQVLDALPRWEPRITVTNVEVERLDDHTIVVAVGYRHNGVDDSVSVTL